MCRYAFATYKPRYACFACRYAFKRRLLKDVNRGADNTPAVCPQCAAPVAEMGLDFAAPKHRDLKAWAALELLWVAGQTFHSCGCGGPGYRPRHPAHLREYLNKTATRYRNHLRAWQAQDDPRLAKNRADAIASWTRRLAKIDAALQRLPTR